MHDAPESGSLGAPESTTAIDPESTATASVAEPPSTTMKLEPESLAIAPASSVTSAPNCAPSEAPEHPTTSNATPTIPQRQFIILNFRSRGPPSQACATNCARPSPRSAPRTFQVEPSRLAKDASANTMVVGGDAPEHSAEAGISRATFARVDEAIRAVVCSACTCRYHSDDSDGRISCTPPTTLQCVKKRQHAPVAFDSSSRHHSHDTLRSLPFGSSGASARASRACH